ncbi:hypothetical protein D3C86_1946130 [compost metagenome]
MFNTTALFNFAASTLKLRTEAAQVPVSTLGKIFRTFVLPAKSFKVTSERLLRTSLKSFILLPTAGRVPDVVTAPPLSVI